MPTLNDIRSTFLNFFEKQGHQIVPSSPLVPRNDPTLMFVNSGMVQFKNLFTGVETRDYNRATTAQKCVRAGGKHNDLDNVGYTARHHTFFEMMGNFSFGNYFKEEAITYAWELLTQGFGIPAERLLVTVYHTDDEAANLWKKIAGLPDERIIRIPTADNFWQMGPTGPCGPCTEIFYDHGDHIWGGPPGSPEEDGDRFIEIWNVVFMQNEQFEDGSMVPLDMQSIDTGMGLERIGALLQGKHDNYDTDLMRSLIEASADVSHSDPDGPGKTHHRVIADHLRSTSFLIADGVMPSNDGRGYVLRRIMRRAMRHAHLLGAKDPMMYKLVPALVRQMGAAYPELGRAQALITETLELEETRFKQTLERGLKLLDDELTGLAEGAALPGAAAFKLYDTFGFPLDLTQDALREKGRSVDIEGFDSAMAEQKAKARAAWSGSGEAADATVWFDVADTAGTTDFLGYDTETAEGQIVALVQDGARVDNVAEGQTVQIALNQTPFYAESGGQVGDTGLIRTESGTARVTDTRKTAGVFTHTAIVEKGSLNKGQSAVLEVDHARRTSIRANHSATHLLHEALRNALGDHVAQRGSLNAADRLRFDFSHAKALSAEELAQVEAEINTYIRQNAPVETRIMTPDDARAIGAQALFGEKYGDEVRVVSMGRADTGKGGDGQTYSIELCGGTHVRQTGDIGACVILGDSASSAGVRRIEALTGAEALAYLRAQDLRLAAVADALKAPAAEVPDRVRALMDERKALANEVAQLRRELAMSGGGKAEPQAEDVNGTAFLAQVLTGVTGKDLPALIDAHKERMGSGAVLLIADDGGKVAVAAGVTKDKTDSLSAVDLVKAAVAELGGKGGGGRADMAQGGAKDATNADAAIKAAKAVIGG
ncbi:alanine--tRNA ligase [Pseudosulfitobacter pseudonitzschiae]|uniref:alanine--tRNA ligase n=1 Tax=Pseudosulfitobacter pseudonitzschiae TaxID=1402135 RepID=UPI001AF51AF9|nr:alanine--tRNA ligase [Pseudosulfitobacter pseudonitzschiae]MBM1814896.1 alanine--tRNA ligase [Pseudosulfitobacter pseudonitzschiae]MBM1831890.1 alanine--tRNA ligase [Pseudosulfitobacter pseudonitzschiae]MBM1836755.1 alanine--tRNA ligase [Pseudosulfitobacter pseudonitzschiae]MBM1841602.1 alanine--tRNA ligase [Pseudosulfitobacter pseudonitzschiae]MBM1846469.1 alanine--tRNA ligase [Pseudosulfitobacter pseudonitzschiae]